MKIDKKNKGFTLLEILLVIALIGILAGIVLVAINPNRQLAQARNLQRTVDIDNINDAIELYTIKNKGINTLTINNTYTEICNTGTEPSSSSTTNCTGKLDLRALVPTYIRQIPRDPQVSSTSTGTGYELAKDNTNKISIKPKTSELSKNIGLNYPDELYAKAGALPNLDLNFARNKSLMDSVTGNNLVTFTRASSGTYVGSDGVLKTATTNLLLRSEEFDNASWAKLNSVTITANAIAAPNGTITADKIVEPASSADKPVVQLVNLAASTTYTASVYFKAAERPTILFHVRKSDYSTRFGGFFNTSTNTFTAETASGGVLDSFVFRNIGNGWYQCSITGNIGANTAGIVTIYMANSSNNISYTGDGTSSLYLWGAQLEQSATVGEYIPTTSTINSAPRFDHNPLTGESLGLLVEEERTNSIRNNTMQGTVGGTPGTAPTNWTLLGSTSGLTQQIVGTGTENGINYIDVRYSGTTTGAISSGTIARYETTTQIAAQSGQTWTASEYIRLAGGSLANISFLQIAVIERSALGGFLDSTVVSITPTAASLATQRRSVTRVLNNASTAFVTSQLVISAPSGAAIDITLRIGMPQLEQGAFATSVIPTTSAAATRRADVANITGSNFSSWYRQDEGTVFADLITSSRGHGAFPRLVAILGSDVNNGNEASIYTRNVSSSEDYRLFGVYWDAVGSTADFSPGSGATLGSGKVAMAIKNNDGGYSLNGATPLSDTACSVPTAIQLRLFGEARFQPSSSGYIRRLTYWPVRLSNANLQSITQ